MFSDHIIIISFSSVQEKRNGEGWILNMYFHFAVWAQRKICRSPPVATIFRILPDPLASFPQWPSVAIRITPMQRHFVRRGWHAVGTKYKVQSPVWFGDMLLKQTFGYLMLFDIICLMDFTVSSEFQIEWYQEMSDDSFFWFMIGLWLQRVLRLVSHVHGHGMCIMVQSSMLRRTANSTPVF